MTLGRVTTRTARRRGDGVVKGSAKDEKGAAQLPTAAGAAVASEPWAEGDKPSTAGRAGQEAPQANRKGVGACGHGGRPRAGGKTARTRRESLPQTGQRVAGGGSARAGDGAGLEEGRRAVVATAARAKS